MHECDECSRFPTCLFFYLPRKSFLQCSTTTGADMSTKDVKFQPVPVFRISLDHAPVERWNDVCDAYGHHFPPLLKR